MDARERSTDWRSLSPGQRAMLCRMDRDGPLHSFGPWEMRTVRSLLDRGLIRRRLPSRDGRDAPGLWFLTDRGRRIIPRARTDLGPAEARIDP